MHSLVPKLQTLFIVPWYNEIVYKIAFSLFSSLLSIQYFEMGRSNKVRHQLRVSFFRRTILLLIHRQFLQFWYQCIKETSIYHIIGNFPQNCHHNTRKTDKDYDFLQSAKLTCVGDLWTQALRSISQSPRATSIRNHSLTSFGISLYRRDFPFSELWFIWACERVANIH